MDFTAHASAIIDPGARIGKGTRIWHFSHIMGKARIGEHCNLGQNVFVGDEVVLGNGVKVQNNVSLYTGVRVEDDVFIGPSAVFTNVINPRAFISRKEEYKPTLLKKGCTIGANVSIVCGVTIGQYAFIGAGAVVVRDIPDFALVVGNPVRFVGWMSRHGERLQFGTDQKATCKVSGEVYRISDHQVQLLET